MTKVIILDEVAKLQCSFDGLAQIVTLRPVDWRQHYLAFRRDVNATLTSLLTTKSAWADVDPMLVNMNHVMSLHHMLATLHHLMSLHQAEWPVVSIDLDNPSYMDSCQTITSVVADIASTADRMRTQARTTP